MKKIYPLSGQPLERPPPIDPTSNTPDWLSVYNDPAIPKVVEKFPRTQEQRELERLTFEAMFEIALDHIIEGRSIKTLINDDPRGLTYGRFMTMLKRDKERLARYWEAKEIGAEAVIEDMKEISDNPDEDVQRSTLRINVRKFEVQTANPLRYGDSKRLDVKTKDVTETKLDMRALKHLSDSEIADLERLMSKMSEGEEKEPL